MTLTFRHPLVGGLVLAAVAWSPALLLGRAQSAPPAQASTGSFPDLVGGLKATPGCLGVETAMTSTGKSVIFAWFENKQALLNWYHSPMHQGVMAQFAHGYRRPGGPLTGVPDEGPVLAVASVTMPTAPVNGDLRSATAQIAIELYAPLPGGLAAGGRFAPSSVKVPGLIEVPSTRK
jgi:hypothetical protein